MGHEKLLDPLVVFRRDLHSVIDHPIHGFSPIGCILIRGSDLIDRMA
jgi:hypothetical protein